MDDHHQRWMRILDSDDVNVQSRIVDFLEELRSPDAVDMLITFLTHAHSRVRSRAAFALGEIGDSKAIPHLITGIDDEDFLVRGAMAGTLARILGESAIPVLADLLRDTSRKPESRAEIAWAIHDLGGTVPLQALHAALGDAEPVVRRMAAQGLGFIGDAQSIRLLIAALADPHESVRAFATVALKQLGDTSAIEPISELLSDPDPTVKKEVISALEDLGDRNAIPQLIHLLSDNDASVRSRSAYTLGKLGERAAVPDLIRCLNDADADVRSDASLALGRIGDDVAADHLRRLLAKGNGRDVKIACAWALSKLGHTEVLPHLLSGLDDDAAWNRRLATEALGFLGTDIAITTLIHVLKNDPIGYVRATAADALGKLEFISTTTADAIFEALHDEARNVRNAAASAIRQLGQAGRLPVNR